MATALELNHIWKKLHRGKLNDCLRAAIPAFFKSMFGMGPSKDELPQKDFWALPDIDFKAEEGERLGFVGHHGTGKSTLLKILSQILAPNRGSTRVNGKLRALIEVGAGFHGDLTGRENTCQNGVIPGMSHSEVKRNFDSIIDFSGIEHFLGMPVKRCSSGMAARLGFAVAARLAPDLLSLGDSQFQKKSLGKMKEAANTGRTILFVSSNTLTVHQLCSRAILLDHGKMVADGNPDKVISLYLQSLATQSNTSLKERTDRFESGEARITNVLIGTSPDSLAHSCIASHHEPLYVRMYFKTFQPLERTVAAIAFQAGEEHIFLANTEICGKKLQNLKEHETIDFIIPANHFTPGKYTLGAEVSHVKGAFYDAVNAVAHLEIDTGGEVFNLSHSWHSRTIVPYTWKRFQN